MSQESLPTIRFANFLSPLLQETYACVAKAVGSRVGRTFALNMGSSLDQFAYGEVDAGFLCGLLYVHLRQLPVCPVELLAAPVAQGERYRGQPIYYSDVVVRRDSAFSSFGDLRGCTWAYNERGSHSGCNLVCYSLLACNRPSDYFGRTLKSGSHLKSLEMVLIGEADATAIDSHVLDVFLQRNPDVAAQVRTVAALGPSTIPPVVVASHLDPLLKQQLRESLITLHNDSEIAHALHEGLIERFVPVVDEQYDDIRTMFAQVQANTFPFV